MDTRNERRTAWNILNALCESSLTDEMDHYRKAVKTDLRLSDDQIERLFNLRVICALLEPQEPKRLYKGQPIDPAECTSCSWTYPLPQEHEVFGGRLHIAEESAEELQQPVAEVVVKEPREKTPEAVEESPEVSGEVVDETTEAKRKKGLDKLLRLVGIVPTEDDFLISIHDDHLFVHKEENWEDTYNEKFQKLGSAWEDNLQGWVFSDEQIPNLLQRYEKKRARKNRIPKN